MSLKSAGIIEVPDGAATLFDHGAFDPTTRRVFIAHTAQNRLEVIDHDGRRHLATLNGFPEAAGVVADNGQVLVTNRGAAELAWVDAPTLEKRAIFETGPRPNGVAIVSKAQLAVVASIGNGLRGPELRAIKLPTGTQSAIDLPGRPRWCVVDQAGERVFLAIREPSIILVARLPELSEMYRWPLPSNGAHGIDIDHRRGFLYVACDGGALLEVDTSSGEVRSEWPLDGEPDATFFNSASGLVHVAVGEPGLVHSIHPRSGTNTRMLTAPGAGTTALIPPDHLYVFSPHHHGVLDLVEEAQMPHSGVYKAGR